MTVKIIKAITTLLSTPVATTFLGFLLGVFGQSISKRRKKKKDIKEFNSFDSMIMNDYIIPIDNLLEEYFSARNPDDVSLIKRRIKDVIERLEYLKENEIYFIKTDNQFKMIRLIEFTKSYFYQINEALDYYSFTQPTANRKEYKRDTITHEKKVKKIQENYSKKKSNYLNLKLDQLSEN